MYCSGHLRVLILLAAMLSLGAIAAPARNERLQTVQPSAAQNTKANIPTTINLRWAPRPGVFRYRLQLAADRGFLDIVFDRVVNGNEYRIDDLPPGSYFWRIAPLTNKLGEFSSAAPIEVRKQTESAGMQREPPDSISSKEQTRQRTSTPKLVTPRGGWRAAVGEISQPVLGHLRSRERFELVGINGDGVILALDASGGVAVWSRRLQRTGSIPPGSSVGKVFLVRSRSGLDSVIALSGANVFRIEGDTGRELWRADLPAMAFSGASLNDQRVPEIFLIDNSLQRLFVLDGNGGKLLSQVRLAHRVVGAPVGFDDQGAGRILLAFDNGDIEVRGHAGALERTGNAGSPVTTSPLFINGPRGNLILVGTRSGLTALSADDLRPLGRVAINGDAPRGNLFAADLDRDGAFEVIMMTERGRIVAVNAVDGKTRWESAVGIEGEPAAFADVNSDGVLDVLVAGGQTFALALSGLDGTLVWKDDEPPTAVANHAGPVASRSILAIPTASGTLVIAADPARTGLRAIEFPIARPNRQ